MAPTSIQRMSQYFASLVPGARLVNPMTLIDLFGPLFNTKSPITATAGGGQAGATPLAPGYNRVGTVVTAADSVILPYAIAGLAITVYNDGANSMQVFGQTGDTMVANGTRTTGAVAANVGLPQASAAASDYVCYDVGQWKQHTY